MARASIVLAMVVSVLLPHAAAPARADEPATELVIRRVTTSRFDSTEPAPPSFEARQRFATRAEAAVETPVERHYRAIFALQPVSTQAQPADAGPTLGGQADRGEAVDAVAGGAQGGVADDPCAAMQEKPLHELGISIALPEGQLPKDLASACWEEVNRVSGPLAAGRYWSVFGYYWDATCLCHRPLYFEQINLERYGYGCPDCLQAGVSAAHFFATVPALPYCMTVECPSECVYTLGHYRPGSCPPWRHHWPPCDPVAGAVEFDVLTALIFLIP